jgi:cytochrome P450
MTGSGARANNGCPVLRIDPFSAEFLGDPYPFHEQLREAGPVVWLERYECWGMARYEQVHATLSDWQTFCSSAGAGLSNFRKEPPWRPPSLLLDADPPAAYADPRRAHVLNRDCL